MKHRNVLYGYKVENGLTVPDGKNSAVVIDIFKKYISGQSLLSLADYLNSRNIEYMPGVTGWNKARIKRLLEDRRYTGTDGYPAIIKDLMFKKVQEIKTSRNTQVETNRNSDIYQLDAPVRCPKCGEYMKRRNDARCMIKPRWVCTSNDCKTLIEKSDEALLSDLLTLMNRVIENTDQIAIRTEKSATGIERIKAENEIGRLLDTSNFDRKQLRLVLLDRFPLAYRDIETSKYIDIRMKADFEKSSPLSDFSLPLFKRNVSEIMFQSDGSVAIRLINHQIISMEAAS